MRNGQQKRKRKTMEVEDALQAMGMVEALYDGTREGAERVARLAIELVESPETFWGSYMQITQETDPYYKLAKRLVDSGAVTKAKTWNELAAMVAEE